MGQPGGRNGPSLPVEHIDWIEGTRGTETSKYPQEEKENSIPRVAASEKGRAQTIGLRAYGVVGSSIKLSRSLVEADWNVPPEKVRAL
jgi:hypothetical protein